MSGISARIDKGQKRFAPTLKARPNRNKTAASEDGTPAPAPSAGSNDSGSFGALLLESDKGSVPLASAAGSTTIHSPQTQRETSRRMSTVTPISPPMNHSRTIGSPIPPTFTSTTSQRLSSSGPSQLISMPKAIADPASSSISDAGSSSPAIAATGVESASSSTPTPIIPTLSPSFSTTPSSRPSKRGSIISVPSARPHTDVEDMENSEGGNGIENSTTSSSVSSSARKRAKGKHVARPKSYSGTAISVGRQNEHAFGTEDGGGDLEGEEDEDAVPDYGNMYMYEFTKDLGVGKRSKVYQEQQKALEGRKRENKKEQRIRAIRIMEGRGPSPPREFAEDDELDEIDDDIDKQFMDDERIKPTKSESSALNLSSAHKTFAPQVRVIDGRIELDMDSLTVDHAVIEADERQEPMEYVEESSSTKFVNSSSFNTRVRSERWSEEETELFYSALSQWGTDFGIICRLFPSKTRIAVRNKYKREDRLNHSRLEAAINNRVPIDLDQYSQNVQREFPDVDELEAIRKLAEEEQNDQALLADHGFEEEVEYEDDAEEIVQEEDDEEIVGEI
ncbi:Transcription factor TFIIIB component B [Mortierella claussenii]|nr:Transcription factor TFIIIB component B [Mortierella claussenii]